MKISDLFRFSTDNLRRRRGRTILTVIGVVVGVCAIVVMVSLGIAVNKATDSMLQNYGDLTKITVFNFGAKYGTPDLDDKMVENFRNMPNVVAATPMYSPNTSGTILAGKNNRFEGYTNLVGVDSSSLSALGYSLVTGQFLDGQSVGRDKIPVMIEAQAVFSFADTKKGYNNPARQIYPEYDDMEGGWGGMPSNLPQYDENGVLLNPEASLFDVMKTPLIYRISYGYDETTEQEKYKDFELVVVGVLLSESFDTLTGSVVMSIEDVKKIEAEYKRLTKSSGGNGYSSFGMGYGGYMGMGGMGGDDGTTQVGGYDNVFVKVDNVKNMPPVEQAIKDIGYQIDSMSQLRQQMQGQVAQTQMMLGGLAAISLFVAALNIANTMTMAIYERTKEIGVMKVLGCSLHNIRQMFLIESGVIGLIGGIAGVILSYLLSFLLNNMILILEWLQIDASIDIMALFGMGGINQMMPDMQVSIIPIWLVVASLLFATMVGILSGIAPANRAVRISSLEAIRHE